MVSARSITLSLVVLAALTACTSAPQTRRLAEAPAEPIAWLELGAGSVLQARAITGAPTCPHLTLDGGTDLPMTVRAQPDAVFPVRVCEARIPDGTRDARLGDQILPVPQEPPRRILFFGDTGCRIVTHGTTSTVQSCNDPHGWPFPSMASHEATLEPDLIVHLGDYLYREAPCPPGNAACAGSPFGYGWEAWNADFFDAARPLLRKAPWVFVRGNHELCKRAGEGWFRFLDGGDMRPCADATAPYLVVQGDVQLVVHDSALATDPKAADDQVPIYRRQFESIAAMHLKHAWLVTHRPLWAPALTDPTSTTPAPYSYNQTLQAASQNHLPRGIDAVLSGHLHLFEELHFADGRPPQIVAGNGGTSLSPAAYNDPTGISLAGTKVDSGVTMSDFGYFTLDRRKNGAWSGTAFDSESRPRLICTGPVRSLRCERAPAQD